MAAFTFTTLPDEPGTNVTQPNGINNSGTIVGVVGTTVSDLGGFIYSNGVYSAFNDPLAGTDAGQYTDPTAINDSGQITGLYFDSNSVSHAFLYSDGSFTTLPDYQGTAVTQPNGINNSGTIVGVVGTTVSDLGGFIYSNGVYSAFNDPLAGTDAGQYTDPTAINDSGQITGLYFDSNSVSHAFLYSDGSFTTLPDYQGTAVTQPNGINNSGTIVGVVGTTVSDLRGFIYSNGDYSAFNDPLAGTQPQQPTFPRAINDVGQITGFYVDGNDISHPFIASSEPVACYCADTLIMTDDGEVPVDKLSIAQRVITASGSRQIKWIGRRSYSGRFIIGRLDILPICFKAGALDDNIPHRDLWVSPHHAMYCEGVLIEAKDLVNGVSVVQAESVERVEYFHIELETHDLIIAEGALSESFIDDDSRGMFHNAHEYGALYPGIKIAPTRYCAPRLNDGYEVAAARATIDHRAGLISEKTAGLVRIRGNLDFVSQTRVAGWAQNPDHPDAPVCLDVFADRNLIQQFLANRYRDDLKQAGIGGGYHSFDLTFSTKVHRRALIEVRRSFDGALITQKFG